MKNNPTGWMAFVAAYREKHPTAILDYKVLMQLYIRRQYDLCVEE